MCLCLLLFVTGHSFRWNDCFRTFGNVNEMAADIEKFFTLQEELFRNVEHAASNASEAASIASRSLAIVNSLKRRINGINNETITLSAQAKFDDMGIYWQFLLSKPKVQMSLDIKGLFLNQAIWIWWKSTDVTLRQVLRSALLLCFHVPHVQWPPRWVVSTFSLYRAAYECV